MPKLAVILPAAGQSLRFGRPKLLEMLRGQSVIGRCVATFLARNDVEAIVIATHMRDAVAAAISSDERIVFAPGGASRADSVRNALSFIGGEVEFVAVHDAARPLVSSALIDRVLAAAIANRAAGPALPVHLHIRRGQSSLPTSSLGTVPRHGLFAMQTPQIMQASLLREAFNAIHDVSAITDDLQLLEAIDIHPTLVAGDEQNLKITTQTDLLLAAFLLNSGQHISQA